MNADLIRLIQELSSTDKKTLSQKALKAAEEVGELAKVVLPFENADSCQHRFSDCRAILEEVADVILTVKSIAYNLNFSEDDLNEMIKEKAIYWAELQNRERAAKFPIPYEIHITIKEAELDKFREVCGKLGVKPVLLDLQNRLGDSVLHDLMTSSVHIGNNHSVYLEMNRISNGLSQAGLEVIRQKIETVPWHPAAPKTGEEFHNSTINGYFESHLAVITTEDQLPLLREIAKKAQAHLSKNVFKRLDDKFFKIMVTYRRNDMILPIFQAKVELLGKNLKDNGFTVDKTIVEFALYDTKIHHDAAWMKTSYE